MGLDRFEGEKKAAAKSGRSSRYVFFPFSPSGAAAFRGRFLFPFKSIFAFSACSAAIFFNHLDLCCRHFAPHVVE